ncbi:MAG: hypothetical protein EPO45_17500 [Sphingobium sp.]|nr:MAG: hypothetical protein EPO45_17500 [Sphingobium sp.]
MTSARETRDMLEQAVEQMLARHHSADALCEGKPKNDLWEFLVELGLPAAELPETCGGLDVAFTDVAPTLRLAGRVLATTYLTEFAIIGAWLVSACASESHADLLKQATMGEVRIALAFAEHGDGGDLAFTRTRASAAPDGWTLTGNKNLVVGGDRATHFVVPAIMGDGSGDLGLFLLPTDAPGLTRHEVELYDGSHAADLALQNVACVAPTVLARGSEARDLIELALDRGRAALAHEIVGLIEAVQEITLEYVKTRKQFGQPIGAFQTMQHRMADMWMELELARSCAQLATDAIAASDSADARQQAVSAAISSICDHARLVGQSAVQAHGGIALTREYLVGHYFKRLAMAERYLGNGDYHLDRYVALANRN